MRTRRLTGFVCVVAALVAAFLLTKGRHEADRREAGAPQSSLTDRDTSTAELPEPAAEGISSVSGESPELTPEKLPTSVLSRATVAGASLEIILPSLPPNRPTGIEGYVYGRGTRLAGAQVFWRTSHDVPHIPPRWKGGFADDLVLSGPEADLTTENPFRPGESFPVRLGAGFTQFETAIVRSFPTEPGTEYELRLDSRFLQGYESITPRLLGEGVPLDDASGQYGIDLTGQTDDPDAETIRYETVIDGPNDLWRRFRTRFEATEDTTSLWLYAAQARPLVNLVWFDGISVQPADGATGESGGSSLLDAPPDADGGPWGFLGSVTTGGEGYYRIEGLHPGDYDVRATYPGMGSAESLRVRVEHGELASVNLNLYGGETIRGFVQEARTADPIPSALVTAAIVPEDAERITAPHIVRTLTVHSDTSGVFRLDELLPEIHYQLSVRAAGFVSPPERRVVPGRGDVVFNLYHEGGITGTVTDRGSRKPVEGAFVLVLREGAPRLKPFSKITSGVIPDASFPTYARVAAAETDANGRYWTGALEPGTYSVVAYREGRLSAESDSDIEDVEIRQPSDSVTVDLELVSGGKIRGKVVEETSKDPVPGLRLGFWLEAPFTLTDVYRVPSLEVDPEKMVRLIHRVPKVIGMFLQRDYDLHEAGQALCLRFNAVTDTMGAFEVDGVGKGMWYVHVFSADYQILERTPIFTWRARVTEVDLTARRVARIEGVVVDENDYPIAGARVWWRTVYQPDRGPWTPEFDWYGLGRSDAEGQFSVRVPWEEGMYDMMASTVDGRLGTSPRAHPGDSEVRIRLEPTGRIEGHVFLDYGIPMIGAKVHARGFDPAGKPWMRETRTDGEGWFSIPHLLPGPYTLEFSPWGLPVCARYGPVEVPKGETVSGIEVVITERAVTPVPTGEQ